MADWSTPKYNVCFKVGGHFKECGVAWEQKAKSGRTIIKVRLDSMPINFDGELMLLERTEDSVA